MSADNLQLYQRDCAHERALTCNGHHSARYKEHDGSSDFLQQEDLDIFFSLDRSAYLAICTFRAYVADKDRHLEEAIHQSRLALFQQLVAQVDLHVPTKHVRRQRPCPRTANHLWS